MEKNNLKVWGWVVVAVVVIVVLMLVLNNKQADGPTSGQDTDTTTTTTTRVESTQDISSKDVGSAAVSLSYENALIKYADRRLQIDTLCHMNPNTVTYKDNTGIMIDNRSPQTRTVKIGTTFTIKPYGFKIVVLPDIYLKSKTLLVDCDKNQNVATILVQE